ncbi:MAG TPA: hypothetical protein DCY86_18170 [Bdellovibrionales bacterium]|nr:hypothetical protein [Bdellovibrionales bacterium]
MIFAIRDASGKLKGYSKLTQDLTERGHLQKLEEVQRATFNILEDFADEREKIREIQHATFNILEDFSSEKERLEDTQHATFNILDDFVKEQEKLEQLQKAAFNILEDLSSEKEKLKSEVDERKRAEIALESVNKELEAFSYSVSHDLRAPLRGLDGFSQALLEDYKDKLDDKGKEYLGYVRSSSQQMAQLIDDLLNLSRMTRSELHRELVNLSELVHGLVELLRKTNPERHAEFRIADSLTAFVDRRLIKIALENLLNNAWKFTNKCAKTIIEFGSLEYEGGKAFFIRDNGAGFDMSYASKLFGAFQRLHAAAEYPGTGIGLATVRRIINRHGGKVWAEGNVGQGATFYFTLS